MAQITKAYAGTEPIACAMVLSALQAAIIMLAMPSILLLLVVCSPLPSFSAAVQNVGQLRVKLPAFAVYNHFHGPPQGCTAKIPRRNPEKNTFCLKTYLML